jgi:hypothetical protein
VEVEHVRDGQLDGFGLPGAVVAFVAVHQRCATGWAEAASRTTSTRPFLLGSSPKT